jgi:hypothetical protein
MNRKILLTIPLLALCLVAFGQNHATVRIIEGSTDAKIIIAHASGESEFIELEVDYMNKKSEKDGVTERNLFKINAMLDRMESSGYQLQQVSTNKDGYMVLTSMIFRKK